MHPINANLAPPVAEAVPRDDEQSWREVQRLAQQCLQEEDVVSAKLLGRLLRLVESRLSLKYNSNVETLSSIMDSLLTIYTTKRISIPMKLKSLNTMISILKYRKNALVLSVTYNYKIFWDEMYAICTRNAKDISCGSESLNSKLFQTSLEFLHEARYYTSQEEAEEIVINAMELMSDLRSSNQMFGVHMLVLCLPTAYANYDRWINVWLEKLASITHNDGWDACWLTMLCRARKFSADAAKWANEASPQLFNKARELLDPFAIPSPAHPHVFPTYFSVMKVSPLDYRKTAIKKVVKLLYLTINEGSLLPSLPPITITPPVQGKGAEIPGMTASGVNVRAGLEPIISFLQAIRPGLYPSNVTARTPDLGYFISCLTTELAQHLGQSMLRQSNFSNLFSLCDSSNEVIQKRFHDNSRDSLIMSKSLHLATARFLAGALCTVSLEGLYAKSQFMVQCCTFSLRSLCAIEPSLGDVVLPFMLASLHPDAVNQSHMAPASMNAIGYICKPLLFPRPVLLPYLNDLLTLSLAGIDANDSKKTMTTLNMYIYIFGWVPEAYVSYSSASAVSESNEVDKVLVPGSDYLTIATGGNLGCDHSEENFQNFHAELEAVVTDWVPRYVDKLFSLLKVKEQLKNSDGKTPPSPLGPYIGEAFDIVVSALSHDVRQKLATQVLDFALDASNGTAAANASKELAKMLESLTGYDDSEGTTLQYLLQRLSQDTLMDVSLVSSEKLVLHIRLIGGCFRQATSANVTEMVDLVCFCFSDEYMHHSDKDVRCAVGKLLKDILKGLTSFYPVSDFRVNKQLNGVTVVGRPQFTTNQCTVKWHVPNVAGVSTAIQLLQKHVSNTMNVIESFFVDESGCQITEGLSVKQKEEKLLTLLDILQHGIRGVSEILGDNLSQNESQGIPLLSTGREEVISSLPNESAVYIQELRDSVVAFLNRLHVHLGETESSRSEEKVNSASTTNSFAKVVCNTPMVREVCMKLFEVVVTQRMACMKNIQSIKKWHGMTRRVKKSALCQYMEKKLGRLYYHLSGGNVCAVKDASAISISSLEYWVGHDITKRSVAERAFIQHIIRQKELSFQATYASISDNQGHGNGIVVALKNLAELNGHEYDSIRSAAYSVFSSVSQRFGRGIEDVIGPLIDTIQTPGSTFSSVSGALKILQLDLVMKRITGNFNLCLKFLLALRLFPSMLLAIDEHDKRERLSNSLSSVFHKYLTAWHHSPLKGNDSNRENAISLIFSILSDFGVDASGSTPVGNASEGGLRHELYLTSSIMTFIGHEDIRDIFPSSVWGWLISTIRTKLGTPMQSLALAALTKLTLVQRSSQESVTPPSISNLLAETFVSSPRTGDIDETSIVIQFLNGISHGHGGNTGGSAQWSKGVDQMLRAGEYLRNVTPRQDSCSFDTHTFSKVFQISNAGLIMNALALALDNTASVTLEDMILSLFEASRAIPTSNDDELRAVNATRAELFGGLSRLLISMEFKPTTVPDHVINSCWAHVNEYMMDNVNKISLDYCGDWAEAIAYGFEEYPQAINGQKEHGTINVISTSILNLAAKTFEDGTCTVDDIPQTENGSGGTGFTKAAKHVLLLTALMVADIGATSGVSLATFFVKTSTNTRTRINNMSMMEVKSSFSKNSQVASRVVEIILGLPSKGGSIFASPYLVLRQELSKVLNLLTAAEFTKTPSLIPLCDKVIRECRGAYQNSQCDSAISNSSDNRGTELVTMQDNVLSDASATPNDSWKNSCDIATLWLSGLTQNKQYWRYIDLMTPLLHVCLEGCAHADVDFSKQCHSSCKIVTQRMRIGSRVTTNSESPDMLSVVLEIFIGMSEHSSLHIRETVMICLTFLLLNNIFSMTVAEKKKCKDVFAKGLLDKKPEVQVLSRKGMIAYLSTKPITELTPLAASYIKNCDILAAREKKKKKLQKQASSSAFSTSSLEKPDDVYMTTIAMSSCMILAFPFDLPSYVPALLTALVRHVSNPSMKDLVTKTVQDFKSTHQDRWSEFKEEFTREQLEDLQGAGAAHYFS